MFKCKNCNLDISLFDVDEDEDEAEVSNIPDEESGFQYYMCMKCKTQHFLCIKCNTFARLTNVCGVQYGYCLIRTKEGKVSVYVEDKNLMPSFIIADNIYYEVDDKPFEDFTFDVSDQNLYCINLYNGYLNPNELQDLMEEALIRLNAMIVIMLYG